MTLLKSCRFSRTALLHSLVRTLRALIESVHRPSRSIFQNRFHCIGGALKQFVHSFQLRLLELSQNELRAVAYRMIRLDSQPHPGELVSAERTNHRLKSVVSRRSAALPDADRAKRQIQLVIHNDQITRRIHLKILNQLSHGEPAEVHESFGLGQQDLVSSELHLDGRRLASAARDIDLAALGDTIDGQKAKIVRRELVLDTGIAQTANQRHPHFLPSAFLPPSGLP